MRYLGLCAIIKDEDLFLDEWIAYHMHLGVTAFYLYDNGSRVPLRASLEKFSGLRTNAAMTVYDAPGKAMQMVVYNHCLRTNGNTCRWIAFVDVDEFIVPKKNDTIPAMLEEFEPHAGLALNWKTFGTNGHKLRPQGLQIENYTRALENSDPMHRHVKCLVDPARVKFFFDPHACMPRRGEDSVVTENHTPIARATTENASWEKGQINHYVYRSYQDYAAKLKKPRADLFSGRAAPERFAPPSGDVDDTSALRFADGVREILARTG